MKGDNRLCIVAEHGTQRPNSSCPRALYVLLGGQEDPVHNSCPPHLKNSSFTSTYPVLVADIEVLQNVLLLKKGSHSGLNTRLRPQGRLSSALH